MIEVSPRGGPNKVNSCHPGEGEFAQESSRGGDGAEPGGTGGGQWGGEAGKENRLLSREPGSRRGPGHGGERSKRRREGSLERRTLPRGS